MSRDRVKKNTDSSPAPVVKSRKAVEMSATFGLILIAVGLVGPFTDLANSDYIRFFKWIYAPGALIYTIARMVGSTDPDESIRLRRLRRLEFWAGIAFCIGAFFWFYNERQFGMYLELGFGQLSCLRDTVYFTLAGGVIQILAIFAIYRQQKKEIKK